MEVVKTVQNNPDIFKSQSSDQMGDDEAIDLIVSLQCDPHHPEKQSISIRQTHLAIDNLMDLGYVESAVNLALSCIKEAEQAGLYTIARDLCHQILPLLLFEGRIEEANEVSSLHARFTEVLKRQFEASSLFGEVYHNQSISLEELNQLKQNLSQDSLWHKLPLREE